MNNNKFNMLLTLQRYGSKSKIMVILDEASLKTAWSQYCRSTRADGGRAILSIKHRESVLKLWNHDWTITAIARDVGVSRTTVYRILKSRLSNNKSEESTPDEE